MTTGRQIKNGLALILFALGCACTPEGFPEDPMTPTESNLPEPDLAPLRPILELAQSADATPDPEDPDPALRQRGEALRSRLESAPVEAATSATSEVGDIESRSQSLRARADAVRAAPDG